MEFNKVVFKSPEYDLVWNRDYSLVKGLFSVNTLVGRVKVPFKPDAMEQYFDGSWKFGTAKLVFKHDKFFLHIPATKEIDESLVQDVKNVVGLILELTSQPQAMTPLIIQNFTMVVTLNINEPNILNREKNSNKGKRHLLGRD